MKTLIQYMFENEDSKPLGDSFWKAGDAYKKNFTEKDADPEELKLGIEEEKEHSDDISVRKKIALDHLAKNKKYYSTLKKAGL